MAATRSEAGARRSCDVVDRQRQSAGDHAADRLARRASARRTAITLLAAGDLPLEVRLERPDMVGIDRLVDAVAVNRLREPGRPAVIVDVGTAITVDLVSADGAFLGGAILPGIQMSARALHEFTDLLPLVDVSELTAPPPALGTATESAMESGLFWGAVGAIRQLIEQLPQRRERSAATSRPMCFSPAARRRRGRVARPRRPLRAEPDAGRHRLDGRRCGDTIRAGRT